MPCFYSADLTVTTVVLFAPFVFLLCRHPATAVLPHPPWELVLRALVTLSGQGPTKAVPRSRCPHGTIDAGAAGISVAGNLNFVALQGAQRWLDFPSRRRPTRRPRQSRGDDLTVRESAGADHWIQNGSH
jgi:hypothetical protein